MNAKIGKARLSLSAASLALVMRCLASLHACSSLDWSAFMSETNNDLKRLRFLTCHVRQVHEPLSNIHWCRDIPFAETGTARNELPPKVAAQFSPMFLNPWYSGQPGSGVQPVAGSQPAPPENGHPASPPTPEEETSHQTYSSDPGQDLIVEQSDLSEDQLRQLTAVQQSLRPGWTVHLTTEGRFYYCNHYNQTR